MHSCGSVFDIIGDLIECGVDALNPIQRSAAKMDIAVMKREFGSELAFWGGGIDVQQVLPTATAEEIDREVKYSIETLSQGRWLRLLCGPQPAARHHTRPHRGHVPGRLAVRLADGQPHRTRRRHHRLQGGGVRRRRSPAGVCIA